MNTPPSNPLATWSNIECWITKNWQDLGMFVLYIITTDLNNKKNLNAFLIDKWCLGIKDTFSKPNITKREIEDTLNLNGPDKYTFEKISYEESRSIALGAILYAQSIGLNPRPSWGQTKHILQPDLPFAKTFSFGHNNGKPFYLQGPHDADELDIQTIVDLVTAAGGQYALVTEDYH